MKSVFHLLSLLLCSITLCAQEDLWVAAHGEEKYGTYCFALTLDGKLLAFHPYYVLNIRDGYTGWDIESEHSYRDIMCARVNPRGEIIAGLVGKGIWKYDSSRKEWENKSGLGTLSFITIWDIYINPEGYIYAGGDNIFSDGRPLWRSRDNGESWQRIGANLTGDAGTIGVRKDGTMYVCGGKGLYRSNDSGETFSPVEEWGATSSIYGEDIEVHSSGVVIVGSNREGGLAWRSDIEGDSFFLLDKISSVAAITIDSLGTIYLFGAGKDERLRVYRSLDTGKTWEEYNSGRTGDGVNNVYDMITTPEGYVFTGGLSIHRTKYRQHNKPVFWGRTQFCNTVEYVVMDSSVNSVQIVPAQSNNVRFEVLSPLGSSKVKIRLMLFDERIPGYFTLRALNAQGMETVYSDTLQKIFPEPVIHQSHDTLWGNGGYVYQWYRNGEKLDGERREFLVPAESGSYSVQVLNAYGCEERSAEFAYIATSVVERASPEKSELWSVVPNPSDGDVTIMYSVGERSMVRLVVVDALGRELGVVNAGIREAGEYSVRWDGHNLSSGMYAVRLECGGQVYSLPLVIVK